MDRPKQEKIQPVGDKMHTLSLESPEIYKHAFKRKFSPTGYRETDGQRMTPSYEVSMWRDARKKLKMGLFY